MLKSDFSYRLPEALIAKEPLEPRSSSRLLVLPPGSAAARDKWFADLANLLQPGDLLVFNDTAVIPARLFGTKGTGGQVEVVVERIQDKRRVTAQIRASKSPKPGTTLELEGHIHARVLGRQDDLYELQIINNEDVLDLLEARGHIPLPPYIDRQDTREDRARYQTVYARKKGAVAAPTAGLHFDHTLLEVLKEKGIDSTFVTLHVGVGTFQPLRVDRIEDHQMHKEYFEIDQAACDRINETRKRGGRVIAVGTTTVRVLESVARANDGDLVSFKGETDIFIYPGFQFRIIDGLITNFHLPESSLLMLVCAFAGNERILSAYHHAIDQRYRFYSYGDAMLVFANRLQP